MLISHLCNGTGTTTSPLERVASYLPASVLENCEISQARHKSALTIEPEGSVKQSSFPHRQQQYAADDHGGTDDDSKRDTLDIA